MNEIKNVPLGDLIGRTEGAPDPGHDAWFRKKVEASLQRSKSGKASDKTLDEVAEKFGFNAR